MSRTLWGYGWGTLLSAGHVAVIGGVDRLSAVPGAALISGPDGRVFVRLGDDPAAVRASQLAELRAVLAPVLPAGTRTLEQYEVDRTAPFATGPPYRL